MGRTAERGDAMTYADKLAFIQRVQRSESVEAWALTTELERMLLNEYTRAVKDLTELTKQTIKEVLK